MLDFAPFKVLPRVLQQVEIPIFWKAGAASLYLLSKKWGFLFAFQPLDICKINHFDIHHLAGSAQGIDRSPWVVAITAP